MRGREVVAETERTLVGFAQPLLAGELLGEQLRDHVHVDAEHRDKRSRARDVLHQDALARSAELVVAHLGKRHAEVGDVLANQVAIQRPRRVVHRVAATRHLGDVARVGLPVHRHHEVVLAGAGDMPILVDPDLVPGGQPLNVRREQVLPGHGHAHAEDRAHQQVVRARRPGAVDVGELQREVIDLAAGLFEMLGCHVRSPPGRASSWEAEG